MFTQQFIIKSDGLGNKLEKYIKKQKVGSGGFAKCYALINCKTQQKVVAKIIDCRQVKDKNNRNKAMQEIEIHRKLNHPHIVKFYDAFEFQNQIYIIMELCQNNSLKEFIKSRVRITEFQSKCYLHQIIQGIQYLHNMNIIHRDIKLGNLFLNFKMQVKIGDFGLSRELKNAKQKRFTTCGTPNYIAPQILKETGHSLEADIWAIGIILYTMLIGKPPFQSQSVQSTYRKIKNNVYEFPKQIPVSNQAKNLIKSILDPNPKTRITLQQLKKHQYLNKDTQKIPPLMPSYTISIPPHINFLKQYITQKNMKLLIYPKKINDRNSLIINNDQKILKLTRVVSADKNLLKKLENHKNQIKQISSLNRGRYIKGIRNSWRCNIKNLKKSSHGEQEYLCSPTYNKMSLKEFQRPQLQTIDCKQDLNQIICYYDISQKYGIAYLLSNGNYGIVFNDQTSLTAVQDLTDELDTTLHYYYFDKNMKIFDALPEFLSKKKQILKLCKNKLSSYRKNNILIPYNSQTYAKKWIKIEKGFLIKLSNGIIQFFWNADSITLRNYKWVRWRINQDQGQGKINQKNFPQNIKEKIDIVREFLMQNCINSKIKSQRKE